jgi:L-fucose isomerase-like protein
MPRKRQKPTPEAKTDAEFPPLPHEPDPERRRFIENYIANHGRATYEEYKNSLEAQWEAYKDF